VCDIKIIFSFDKEYNSIDVGTKDVERISECIGKDIKKWQKIEI